MVSWEVEMIWSISSIINLCLNMPLHFSYCPLVAKWFLGTLRFQTFGRNSNLFQCYTWVKKRYWSSSGPDLLQHWKLSRFPQKMLRKFDELQQRNSSRTAFISQNKIIPRGLKRCHFWIVSSASWSVSWGCWMLCHLFSQSFEACSRFVKVIFHT